MLNSRKKRKHLRQMQILFAGLFFVINVFFIKTPAECNAQELNSQSERQSSVSFSSTVTNLSENKKTQKRKCINKIADYMEKAQKELNKKIAVYLRRAEAEINKGNFDSARSYIEKANKIKTSEQRIIKDKARELAEQEIYKQAEKEKIQKLAKQIPDYFTKEEPTESREASSEQIERKRGEVSVEEGKKEAESLLQRIDKVQKVYEEQKRKEEKRKKFALERAHRQRIEAAERAKKEAKMRKQTQKIAEYLAKAEQELDRNEFNKARMYVKKALAVKEASRKIVEAEQKKEKEKGLFKEEEAKREIKRRVKKEKDARKRQKKIAGYLEKAEKQLENKKFNSAQRYAEKVLEIDANNLDARDVLNRIGRDKADYERQKKKKIISKRKAVKKAPKEKLISEKKDKVSVKRTIAEKKMRRQEEKTAGYLEKAKKELTKNRFEKARGYVKRALKIEKDNPEAQEMLANISRQEGIYREKEVRTEREKKARIKADKAAAEREKREERKKRLLDKKIGEYISKSRKYFEKGNYRDARRFAYKARDLDQTNDDVAVLIADIDKAEMFGIKKEGAEKRTKKVDKALKKFDAEKEDPFKKYDEGKGWFDYVTGIFKKRPYKLGYVQEGRIYSIDECVQLALRRSQRMKVADKQVKLAETRVWEVRRELFPSVTTRIERSTGKIGTATGPRHYQGEKYQVELKHNIFDGMGSWFTLRQTQTNNEIVKLEKQKVKNEIVAETKTAYYNLDKAIKAFAVQEMYKKKVNSFYEIAKNSFEQRLIAEMEYLKVKGQNMQADFQYASSKEDITLAEIILFQAMNVNPDYSINIQPVRSPKETLTIGLENCYRLAYANRPDFKIKEKMIEYYELDRKMSKAKGWPKIDFQGSFGKSYETYQPTEDDDEKRQLSPEWYAGIKGSVPIWGNTLEYNYVREKWAPVVSTVHGTESATSYLTIKFLDDLAYFTNLAESRAGFESAKYEYLKYKKDLTVEVKEVYFKYKKALLQIDVANAQVEHQKMFVDVLEERRSFGEMELSKIIEEYEKFTEQRYSLIQGYASYFIALAELSKAIGVPDYFDPGHEDQEYGVWEPKIFEEKTDIKDINTLADKKMGTHIDETVEPLPSKTITTLNN